MERLSILDFGFLVTETQRSPKHVGGLMIFQPPEGYPGDFVNDLFEELRRVSPRRPFNQRLKPAILGLPSWVQCDDLDVDAHLHHLALPYPGGEQELMDLVGELHSPPLDRGKPLWEACLIEGLEGGRFALYCKIHHACADGLTLMDWLQDSLSKSAADDQVRAIWGLPGKRPPAREASYADALAELSRRLGRQLLSGAELLTIGLKHGLRALAMDDNKLPIPFSAPRTILNRSITRDRRAAVFDLPLERVRAVARATGTSINEVLLTLMEQALRRYLEAHHAPPDVPLVVQIPVDVRSDQTEGNAIAILLIDLGAGSADPVTCLREIRQSSTEVLGEFKSVSAATASAYTLILQLASQVMDALNLAGRLPPLGNSLLSNIAGPPHPLYLKGARLLRLYPVNTIAPCLVMNVTALSYNGTLGVSCIAATNAMPDLPEFAAYMRAAFEQLESAVAVKGAGTKGRSRSRPRKTAPSRATAKKTPPAAKKDTTDITLGQVAE